MEAQKPHPYVCGIPQTSCLLSLCLQSWDPQMFPVSSGLLSSDAKAADAVFFPGRIWNTTKCSVSHFLHSAPSMNPSHLSFCVCLMGCSAGEELQLQVRRSGGQMLGCCFGLVMASSVATSSSANHPLFPVHCFLNHFLCKTTAEVGSQKCSEALGVKYGDKRRHSSSLLHRTF